MYLIHKNLYWCPHKFKNESEPSICPFKYVILVAEEVICGQKAPVWKQLLH